MNPEEVARCDGRLMVYGTLHPRLAPERLSDITGRMKLVGPATVRGRLYSLGRFPGLVLDPAGRLVHGYVFELPPGPEVLTRLDRYEGYEASMPDRSLFVRVSCEPLDALGGSLSAWVYVYNQPLDGAAEVASGNWIDPKLKAIRP